jgi:hypothetical protein
MGSIYSAFCSKSRTSKLNNQEQVVFNCKVCRDKIKAYIKRLEVNERKKMDKVKQELKNNNREKAKMYLNQSKLYKEQQKIAQGQLNMIEDQIAQIELAEHQKDAIKVLEEGNTVLKNLTEDVNIDKWEKIADDMNEIKQQHDEIGNFLKNHHIDQTEFDEAIDNEMANLMMDLSGSDVKLPKAGIKEHKPVVLEEAAQEAKEDEEKEKQLVEA